MERYFENREREHATVGRCLATGIVDDNTSGVLDHGSESNRILRTQSNEKGRLVGIVRHSQHL